MTITLGLGTVAVLCFLGGVLFGALALIAAIHWLSPWR